MFTVLIVARRSSEGLVSATLSARLTVHVAWISTSASVQPGVRYEELLTTTGVGLKYATTMAGNIKNVSY